MTPDSIEKPSERGLKQRLGFWGGLVLFAFVVSRPQADGMFAAARAAVRAEARTRIVQRLRREGIERGQVEFRERLDRELAALDPHVETEARRRAAAMIPTAAITVLIAVWWMTEAIPIPATSLLPLLLFPSFGVLPLDEAAVPYANPSIFLYLGGFIIALGIERWNLHRRIALRVVQAIGTSRRRIVLAFMVATALLSMWISNTATTLMMLPIALAVLATLGERTGVPSRSHTYSRSFGGALMLGICYSASIGGVASPIGTPTNIAFLGQYQTMFPTAPPISFARWVLCFAPFSLCFLMLAWWVVTRLTNRVPAGTDPAHRQVISDEARRLSRLSGAERWMVAIGLATAVLWMTRGSPRHDHPGWSMLLLWLLPQQFSVERLETFVNDTTVALFMALLLFIIPGGRNETGRRVPLMDWNTAVRLPWGILLLFGGGFSIAHVVDYTGLAGWTGQLLAGAGLEHVSSWIVGCVTLMTFLTEITSNTATTQVMLPVLQETATQVGLHPLALMLPAAIAASCAFMLPVSTPPNAIVFGSGRVTMGQMVRNGFVLNLLGIVLVTFVFLTWVTWLLGFDPTTVPAWAASGV